MSDVKTLLVSIDGRAQAHPLLEAQADAERTVMLGLRAFGLAPQGADKR